MLKTILILLSFIWSTGAFSENIRIGSWNIENLHHKPFFKLRPFGTYRKPAHLKLLENYAKSFGRSGTFPDIVALQEIGTPEGVELLFSDSEFEILLSPRAIDTDQPKGEGDVYTAIAIRRTSGLEVVERDDIVDLAVLHSDGHATRAGTAALVQKGDFSFWFVSVHLKSSCPDTKNLSGSTADNCETLWKQAPILADWIAEKRATEVPVIIAGDFNRKFRQMGPEGHLWTAIAGKDVANPFFISHPETATRRCPTKKGGSTQPIDWILLDDRLKGSFVTDSFWETRYSYEDQQAAKIGSSGTGLSDHCPISIDLTLG